VTGQYAGDNERKFLRAFVIKRNLAALTRARADCCLI
jgi:hypothetical protein